MIDEDLEDDLEDVNLQFYTGVEYGFIFALGAILNMAEDGDLEEIVDYCLFYLKGAEEGVH